MVLSPEARVGTIAIIGVLVAVMVVIFLGGLHMGPKGYLLRVQVSDAHGLERGAAVRLSGVKVGEVTEVNLTERNEALVTISLKRGVQVWDSSLVEIKKGGLLGEYFISITPTRKKRSRLVRHNAVVNGHVEPQLEDLVPQAYELLGELKGLSGNLRSLTHDKELFQSLKQTVIDVSKSAAAIRSVIADPRLMGAVRSSALNVQAATGYGVTAARNVAVATRELDRVQGIIKNVEAMTAENRDEISGILSNLEATAKNINAVSDTVKWLAADSGTKENIQQAVLSLTQSAKNIEQSTAQMRNLVGDESVQSNVKQSLDNLRKSLENVEGSTAALKQMMTDQELQSDIKATVHSARETMDNAKAASQSVQKVVERVSKNAVNLFDLQVTPEFNSRYLPAADRIFTDFSIRLARAEKSFLMIGMHDIGESDRLNLQGGILRDPLALRLGIYRSRIGVGADYHIGSGGTLSFDAFDPNDPQFNIWGGVRLNDRFRLMLGVEDVTNRRLGGFGFAYTR